MNLNKRSEIQRILSNDQNFINNIMISINNIINNTNVLTLLYQDELRKVKYFKDLVNNVYYIFEENEGETNVYLEKIYYFNKEKTAEELFKNDVENFKQKKKGLYGALKICSIFSEDEAIKRAKAKEDEVKDFVEKFKKENPPEEWCKIKEFINSTQKELPIIRFFITYDLYTIAMFNQFLAKYSNAKEYSYEFYLSLANKAISLNIKNVEIWQSQKSIIKYLCLKYKFNKENKFEVGDGDCYVWLENEDLFMQDQNCTFYFKEIDRENYQIYLLDTEASSIEKEMKVINNYLENKNENIFDMFKLLMLKVENNNIVYVNEKSYSYFFDINISTTTQVMLEEIQDEKINNLIEESKSKRIK